MVSTNSFVMRLLNHSLEVMILSYLGLDNETIEKILDNINFG